MKTIVKLTSEELKEQVEEKLGWASEMCGSFEPQFIDEERARCAALKGLLLDLVDASGRRLFTFSVEVS